MLASLFTGPQPRKDGGSAEAAAQQHVLRGVTEQGEGSAGGGDTRSATPPGAGFAFKFAFD